MDTYNSAPDDCTEKLKIAAEWIQENNPEINEGRLMGFGKHKSETMEWVYENDQATQLLDRVTLRPCPRQKPFVQSLNTFAGERIFCYKQIELSSMWVLQVVPHGFTSLILIQIFTSLGLSLDSVDFLCQLSPNPRTTQSGSCQSLSRWALKRSLMSAGHMLQDEKDPGKEK